MAKVSGSNPGDEFKQTTKYAADAAQEVARLREEYRKLNAEGQKSKLLDLMVDLEKASRNANIDGIDRVKRSVQALEDVAGKSIKSSSKEMEYYGRVSGRSFSDASKGSGAMRDRLRDLARGYSEVLGMSKKEASAAVSGQAGAGNLYNREQELGYITELSKQRKALANEGKSTAFIDERIARKKSELAGRNMQDAKGTAAAQMQMKAVAENASKGLTTALSKDSGAFGTLAQKATDSKTVVGSALRTILSQEKLASKGVAAGGVAGAVGGGVSMAIGQLAKTLAPLSSALTGTAIIGKLLIGVFEGLSNASKVGGHQMRALGMNADVSMGQFNSAMMGSQAAIQKFAGLGFGSLATIGDVFNKEVIPAAQKGMLQFNTLDRSRGTIDSWTGALAASAVQGAAWGIPYEVSVGKMVRLGKSFGNSAEQTQKGFRDIMVSARMASLTMDEVEGSMGDMDDTARRLGRGGMSMLGQIGMSLKGARPASGAQASMMAGGVAGLAGDRYSLIGLASAVMGPKAAMSAYVGAHGGEGAGANMYNLALRSMGGAYRGGAGKIGGMSPQDILGNKNAAPEMKFQASEFMGAMTKMSAEAFLDPEFKRSFDEFTKAPSKGQKDKLEAESRRLSGDLTQKGLDSMQEQVGVLEKIAGLVENIARTIGVLSGSMIGRMAGAADVQRDIRAESMNPNMGVRETTSGGKK
jgi:hypothetical protein